jgi:hypothetical protein
MMIQANQDSDHHLHGNKNNVALNKVHWPPWNSRWSQASCQWQGPMGFSMAYDS